MSDSRVPGRAAEDHRHGQVAPAPPSLRNRLNISWLVVTWTGRSGRGPDEDVEAASRLAAGLLTITTQLGTNISQSFIFTEELSQSFLVWVSSVPSSPLSVFFFFTFCFSLNISLFR